VGRHGVQRVRPVPVYSGVDAAELHDHGVRRAVTARGSVHRRLRAEQGGAAGLLRDDCGKQGVPFRYVDRAWIWRVRAMHVRGCVCECAGVPGCGLRSWIAARADVWSDVHCAAVRDAGVDGCLRLWAMDRSDHGVRAVHV
jgi:hypothetical protein